MSWSALSFRCNLCLLHSGHFVSEPLHSHIHGVSGHPVEDMLNCFLQLVLSDCLGASYGSGIRLHLLCLLIMSLVAALVLLGIVLQQPHIMRHISIDSLQGLNPSENVTDLFVNVGFYFWYVALHATHNHARFYQYCVVVSEHVLMFLMKSTDGTPQMNCRLKSQLCLEGDNLACDGLDVLLGRLFPKQLLSNTVLGGFQSGGSVFCRPPGFLHHTLGVSLCTPRIGLADASLLYILVHLFLSARVVALIAHLWSFIVDLCLRS